MGMGFTMEWKGKGWGVRRMRRKGNDQVKEGGRGTKCDDRERKKIARMKTRTVEAMSLTARSYPSFTGPQRRTSSRKHPLDLRLVK
jgi:hypothetical protein